MTTPPALRMRSEMEVSDDRIKEILADIVLVEGLYKVDGMSMIVSPLPELNSELTLACCGKNDSVILGEVSPVVLWRSAPYVWHCKRAKWHTILCNVDETSLRFEAGDDSWTAPRRSPNVEIDLVNQKIVHATGCYICWEPIDEVTYKADVLIWA